MIRTYSWRRVTRLFLAVALLFSILLPAGLSRPAATAFAQTNSGMIRVLLTRLQLTDRLDAELDGSYSVEPGGMAFQRGSNLTLSCAKGTLMLYYEGMVLEAGDKIVLRRHEIATGEENGLRLNGDYSLYAGDLTVSVQGGMLRAVLQLPVEEYLLGVVPYEMSDSFPLEALKAQAVTARTYALKRVGSSQDYDVVDNTNDQVYKGLNTDNMRAAQAVKETENVVGYYNGGLADCYYSASNGGQTELVKNVWGGDGDGLSVMKDDPYDLENPASQVRSYMVLRTPGEDDALAPLLVQAVASPLAALGYDSDPAYIRITTVSAVSLHTPRYGEPSKVMSKLRLTVQAEARKPIPEELQEAESHYLVGTETGTPLPSATPGVAQFTAMQPVPDAVTVDLDVFPDVETALGLSINGDGNEILTVTETDEGFDITARRFGHGVGMSQRGAEWMALQYNWTFAQILEFYYPAMKLVKTTANATLQPPISADFLATPGPPATPTPRPTLMPVTQTPGPGQWLAKVTLIGENSYLNMRAQPNLSAPVLRQLYYGQTLLVLEELQDGWLKVMTDAAEGYVMSSFVEK